MLYQLAFIKVSPGTAIASLKIAGLTTVVRNTDPGPLLWNSALLNETVFGIYMIRKKLYLDLSKYVDKLLAEDIDKY